MEIVVDLLGCMQVSHQCRRRNPHLPRTRVSRPRLRQRNWALRI